MRRYLFCILLLAISLLKGPGLSGQSPFPSHSQYINNGMVINPAYAGSRGAMSVLLSLREQWIDVDGAPSYQSASLHAPLGNDRVALGLLYSGLNYGVTSRQSFFGVYAYHIHMGRTRLSLGLQGGVDIESSDYGSVITNTPDPTFRDASEYMMLPNVGAGIYLYSDNFFMGVSVPAILSYRDVASPKLSDAYYSYRKSDILFLTGGAVSLGDLFVVSPSTLFRYSPSMPYEVDLNLNFIIADILWLGGSWRVSEEALVGIAGVNITPRMKLGYSYDYMMGNLSNFSSGTHELMIRFELGYRISAQSPRYF